MQAFAAGETSSDWTCEDLLRARTSVVMKRSFTNTGGGARATPALLERLSRDHLTIINEKLRRTLIRSANYRQQSGQLFARNQAQGAAFGAGEHGPIGIVFFSDAAGVLQHKDGAGEHLFGDPLA